MSKKQKYVLTALRITALLILILVFVYTVIRMSANPNTSYEERIVNIVSTNKIIALIEFIILYVLKGISFFFPSAVITIAAGIVFGFPLSILVCFLGILAEFIVMYMIGRFLGKDIIEWMNTKYPAAKKIDSFQMDNCIFMSFVLRITGIISYDLGSVYLGASGVKFSGFIIGSMMGAFLNIAIYTIMGSYIFNPFSWQLWAVVGIRIIVIISAVIIRRWRTNKENMNSMLHM